MMASEFRKIALALPETEERAHMDHPEVFVPVKGTWGKRGAGSVFLKSAEKDVLSKALICGMAFQCA